MSTLSLTTRQLSESLWVGLLAFALTACGASESGTLDMGEAGGDSSVAPEVVGVAVVGDIDVEQPVRVEVCCHDAQPGGALLGDARLLAHVQEARAALVLVEQVR